MSPSGQQDLEEQKSVREPDAPGLKWQGTRKVTLVHPDTYTGAKAVGLLGHNIEKVLRSSLLPRRRAVIPLKQDGRLLQNLHRETKFILSLEGEEERPD